MFQLTAEEAESLRLQFATSNVGRGGRRYLPYAFTEHGVAMLSSVLHSPRAVQMNILIIRAFVKLRELLANHKDLARRIEQLEVSQRQQAPHTSRARLDSCCRGPRHPEIKAPSDHTRYRLYCPQPQEEVADLLAIAKRSSTHVDYLHSEPPR